MNVVQQIITVGFVTLGTVITRFLPFILFPDNHPIPKSVQYMGKVLPYAAIGLLVVYCLKSVDFLHAPYGMAEALGVIITAGLHIWKRNMFLSISAGTIAYILLMQMVF